MKLNLYIEIFVFLFSSVKGDFIKYDIETYSSVIVSVRNYYSCSTVFLVHSADKYEDYRELGITSIVHKMMRIIGRNGIVTLNYHLRRMNRIQRYYSHIVRPLIVVMFHGKKEILEFANITANFRMSFAVWLLIFLPGSEEQGMCHKPQGNPFHLAFDTEMLVLCENDNVIRDWYSIDGKRTETFDLARWEPEKDFVPLTKLGLYERRNTLNGTTLRAVVVTSSRFLSIENDELHGFFGEIFRELTEAINLKIVIVNRSTSYGSYSSKYAYLTGAVAEVASGRADIGIADFSMTPHRLAVLDYTLPLIVSRNVLCIMQPQIFGVQWFAYFKTFDFMVWLSIIMTIVFASFILVYIWKCINSSNMSSLLSDNFLYIWGIFCQQGLTDFPERSSLRIAYVTIFATAMVTSAAYSASLICFLAACIRVLPFSSVEEFSNHGSFKLSVVRHSADYDVFTNTNETLFRRLKSLILPESRLPTGIHEGFQQICKDAHLALYTSEVVKTAIAPYIPCKISTINTGGIDSFGIILSKHSPYTDIINHHLHKFSNNGMLNRFKGNTLRMGTEREIIYQPVELVSVAPILAILSGGILLSAIILLMEKCYYKYRSESKRTTVMRTPSNIIFSHQPSFTHNLRILH